MEYQRLIIEDTENGTNSLEVRLISERPGIFGVHRFLQDREGRAYWWFVGPRPDGRSFVQKLISFADWEALENEVGDMCQFIKKPRAGLTRVLH